MIRPTCGTMKGFLAHEREAEPVCGFCLRAERVAALEAEALLPVPPPPAVPVHDGPAEGFQFRPVTRKQASANWAALRLAVGPRRRQRQRGAGRCRVIPPVCSHCGKPRTRRTDNRGWTGYRGWCSACAERWRAAGKPAEGPARTSSEERARRISAGLRRWHASHQQSDAARLASARGKVDRLQDYAWLVGFGETREAAARRAGVSMWTARWVYDRVLAGVEEGAA